MKLKFFIYCLLFIGFKVNAQTIKTTLNIDWLSQINKKLIKKNSVKPPYIPLILDGNTISMFKSKLVVNADGFPKQIQTIFKNGDLKDSTINLIIEPIHFHFFSSSKNQEKFISTGFKFVKKHSNTISWKATNTSNNILMDIFANIEANGYVSYQIKITALNDVNFSDINFHIPMEKTIAKHLLGLGVKAILRPDTVKSNWTNLLMKNGVWIGDSHAGLYYNVINQDYARNSLASINKNLNPLSWQNEGKGGVQIGVKGSSMLVDNFTGTKTFKKGDVIYYNFNLLILPLIKENQFNK